MEQESFAAGLFHALLPLFLILTSLLLVESVNLPTFMPEGTERGTRLFWFLCCIVPGILAILGLFQDQPKKRLYHIIGISMAAIPVICLLFMGASQTFISNLHSTTTAGYLTGVIIALAATTLSR